MNDLRIAKDILRRDFIALRKAISQREKQKASTLITQELLNEPVWHKAKIICLYVSEPDEVDTHAIMEEAFRQKKTVVVPRVCGQELCLHEVRTPRDLVRGPFQTLEPKQICRQVQVSSVELFIVPALAFDRKGYRLGWGKGYYDRLLHGVTVPRVGLAYAKQIVAHIPHTSYDVPMSTVVTEKDVIYVR